MHSAFQSDQFLLKRQIFALTGVFRIYDRRNDALVMFSRQKMFKLREDIRIYTDEQSSQEILRINARNIIDFSAAYDVYDPTEQTLVGTLRRKGLHSILRDQWEVLDPSGKIIGILQEDSTTMALIRRTFGSTLLPQDYDLISDGNRIADLKQRFHLFRYDLDITFLDTTALRLDRRLGIAAGILLAAIEGKQE